MEEIEVTKVKKRRRIPKNLHKKVGRKNEGYNVVVAFKATKEMSETVRGISNTSEFIRNAIKNALIQKNRRDKIAHDRKLLEEENHDKENEI